MTPTTPHPDLNDSVRRDEIKRAAEGMKEAIARLEAARLKCRETREMCEFAALAVTPEAITAIDDLDQELRDLKRTALRQILPEPQPATMPPAAPPRAPSGRSGDGSDNSTPQAKETPFLWGIAPASAGGDH